jgi:chemotaxis signal transduction protein
MTSTNSAPRNRVFDWQGAYARLARVQEKLDASEHPLEADVARLLRQRAADYARPPSVDANPELLDVIEFEVNDARFAITLDSGAAAASLAGLTILPGVPPFYLGLLSYRGAVFPVIDIRMLLGRSRESDKDMRYAVLMRNAHGAIGLAATEILGITQFRSDRIALSSEKAVDNRAILGIGPNSTTIIDATRLLQDMRLMVDDQPEVAVRSGGEGV